MAERTGPTNSLVDVPGLRVGHAERRGDGWLTGTTVVLADVLQNPDGAAGGAGAVAGVDVRGGGPGTRETDLLDPRTMVQQVHAVVLTGGSAFGLGAADGVMAALRDRGIGFAVGTVDDQPMVVPIVPAAVVFDLGRGGQAYRYPDPELGAAACADAFSPAGAQAVRQGSVGAGTGCRAGGLPGGIGSASTVLDDGTVVGALAVVNPHGSCLDPDGRVSGTRYGLPGEFDDDSVLLGAAADDVPAESASWATTLVVLGTDLALTQAQCAKVSGIGHDGLARAISPVHTMVDGDVVFTLSTGRRALPDDPAAALGVVQALLGVAADCVSRAVAHAVLAAQQVTGQVSE